MSEAVIEEAVEEQEVGLPELPEGWEWRTVAEVAPIRRKPRGLSLPKQVPFVAMADISETAAPITEFQERDREKVTSSYFEDGDLLISRITPCFENGKQGVVRGVPGGFGFATTEVYALACGEDAIADYLNLLLSSPLVRGKLIPTMEGATGRMRLPKSALEELVVPVPPIEIQRRLVTKIAERFGEISELNAQLDVTEKLQVQFRQALLRDAFTGRLTHGDDLPDVDEVDEDGRPFLPEGWEWRRLADLVENLDRMRVPVNRKERAERAGDIPYYGATGQVDWIDDHIFDEELVLLGEDGVSFLDPRVEKAYLVSGKSWVNNHAHVLRPRKELIGHEFLCSALNTLDYREAVGGTTRLKLTQGKMNELLIPCPTIPIQNEVMARLNGCLVEGQHISETVMAIRKDLLGLQQSLLHQAFTGQLVA